MRDKIKGKCCVCGEDAIGIINFKLYCKKHYYLKTWEKKCERRRINNG